MEFCSAVHLDNIKNNDLFSICIQPKLMQKHTNLFVIFISFYRGSSQRQSSSTLEAAADTKALTPTILIEAMQSVFNKAGAAFAPPYEGGTRDCCPSLLLLSYVTGSPIRKVLNTKKKRKKGKVSYPADPDISC